MREDWRSTTWEVWWIVFFKESCNDLSIPYDFLNLNNLPSRGRVHIPSPWTWVGPCDCLDKQTTEDMMLCDLCGSVIKMPCSPVSWGARSYDLVTILPGSPFIWWRQTESHSPGWAPRHSLASVLYRCEWVSLKVSPLVATWAIPAAVTWSRASHSSGSCWNYRFISKINNCCFRPLSFGVVC